MGSEIPKTHPTALKLHQISLPFSGIYLANYLPVVTSKAKRLKSVDYLATILLLIGFVPESLFARQCFTPPGDIDKSEIEKVLEVANESETSREEFNQAASTWYAFTQKFASQNPYRVTEKIWQGGLTSTYVLNFIKEKLNDPTSTRRVNFMPQARELEAAQANMTAEFQERNRAMREEGLKLIRERKPDEFLILYEGAMHSAELHAALPDDLRKSVLFAAEPINDQTTLGQLGPLGEAPIWAESWMKESATLPSTLVGMDYHGLRSAQMIQSMPDSQTLKRLGIKSITLGLEGFEAGREYTLSQAMDLVNKNSNSTREKLKAELQANLDKNRKLYVVISSFGPSNSAESTNLSHSIDLLQRSLDVLEYDGDLEMYPAWSAMVRRAMLYSQDGLEVRVVGIDATDYSVKMTGTDREPSTTVPEKLRVRVIFGDGK